MKEAATLMFEDVESSDEATVVVRYDESKVALCLSLEADGDLEVFMRKEVAKGLIEALKKAVE